MWNSFNYARLQCTAGKARLPEGILNATRGREGGCLSWSTVVNQLWRRFVPGFCHIIILLNVEFVQLRPIAVVPEQAGERPDAIG